MTTAIFSASPRSRATFPSAARPSNNLEKIQRQLAESQKLDALGQLTGGVAHDFNNLLMIITGNIHILKRLAGNDAKGQRAVQAIEKASQHGASLTRQLLTFARRQSVSPQTVDLSERIHSLSGRPRHRGSAAPCRFSSMSTPTSGR